MPVMLLTVRRFHGKSLVTCLREQQSGRVVVSTPVELWRKGRKRVEIGGRPFPRFGPSQIATLAAAMVAARVTGGEPPMVPRDMPPADVGAALRVVETLLD